MPLMTAPASGSIADAYFYLIGMRNRIQTTGAQRLSGGSLLWAYGGQTARLQPGSPTPTRSSSTPTDRLQAELHHRRFEQHLPEDTFGGGRHSRFSAATFNRVIHQLDHQRRNRSQSAPLSEQQLSQMGSRVRRHHRRELGDVWKIAGGQLPVVWKGAAVNPKAAFRCVRRPSPEAPPPLPRASPSFRRLDLVVWLAMAFPVPSADWFIAVYFISLLVTRWPWSQGSDRAGVEAGHTFRRPDYKQGVDALGATASPATSRSPGASSSLTDSVL